MLARPFHTASAVVKAVDPVNSKVTLAHGPIESLQWPAMTMGFVVDNKALFEKLVVGEKIDVESIKKGSGYAISRVGRDSLKFRRN